MNKQIVLALVAIVMVMAGSVVLLSDSSYAVEMDDSTYSTISEAIDAAPVEGTQVEISLTGNMTESITITEGKDIVLNLGTYTLTNTNGSHTITVRDGAKLTIEGDGTVDNVSHARACIQNDIGGTVILNGGTYIRSLENGIDSEDSGGNSFYCIRSYGNMTINEGVTVLQNGHFSSMIENGHYNGNETNPSQTNAVIVINGGTFSGGLNTIKNDDWGVITINGGSFSNMTQHTVQNYNIAIINGGSFTIESERAIVYNQHINDTMDQGRLTITGGSFEGDTIFQNVDGTISISGGSFSKDVSGYVVSGCSQVGTIVGPNSTDESVSSSNSDVVADSNTDTVIIPVDDVVSNATVSATVTVSDGSKVGMVYQGGLTTDGLAMSASQVTVENLPSVSKDNLLTVYELNVTGGITQGSFDLTVTIDVDIPDGMVLSSAWVVYYGDYDVTESYRATVDGSSVTFTTNHTSTYAFYGEIVEEQTPLPPVWDDDDDYVPPVYVPEQDSGSDDTVTIVACAAAAVVAAIMAVFLIIERKH